jgi:kanamycin kinase
MELPAELRRRYLEWSWSLVHAEEATWRLQDPTGPVRYLKLGTTSRFPRVLDEGARMQWAKAHLPVPEVLDCGTDGTLDWLVTAGLPGRPVTDQQLTADPERLVALLARGLRRFHAAPVAACPFDFRLDTALAHAQARVQGGLVDPDQDFHPEHRHLTPIAALAELERLRPDAEDLVVCHGDYCPPNILIADGEITGFVDLGELGVADRWWDLAIGSWSITWSLGPGWEDLFLRSYGANRDLGRVAFYRLLYDLVS